MIDVNTVSAACIRFERYRLSIKPNPVQICMLEVVQEKRRTRPRLGHV
jgi:hypothetical protein